MWRKTFGEHMAIQQNNLDMYNLQDIIENSEGKRFSEIRAEITERVGRLTMDWFYDEDLKKYLNNKYDTSF